MQFIVVLQVMSTLVVVWTAAHMYPSQVGDAPQLRPALAFVLTAVSPRN